MARILIILCIGVVTGILSGLFGIGGGIILVPMLIFLLKFSQSTASGTSLVALLLPVGIFGVIEYYKSGRISVEHIRFGLLIALGIIVGTYIGARIGAELSENILRRSLSIFMVLVAIKLWLSTV